MQGKTIHEELVEIKEELDWWICQLERLAVLAEEIAEAERELKEGGDAGESGSGR